MTEILYTSPKIFKNSFTDKHLKDNRLFQGIPSIEVTRGGRLFADWQIGGNCEPCNDNCVLLATSDDNGKTWLDPYMVIDHDEPESKLCNPILWLDPLDRLWFFWMQNNQGYFGNSGVWAIRCDAPDAPAESLAWTEPHRYSDHIIVTKPTVTKGGAWLYTAQDIADRHVTYTYSSTDGGESFDELGAATSDFITWSESMIIERGDGLHQYARVDNNQSRSVERSVSHDGGVTWSKFSFDGIEYPFVGAASRFFLRRMKSGNLLYVHNDHESQRTNMTAKLSLDDGKTWHSLLLDDRMWLSYPDGAQDENGVIRVIYDRGRSTDKEIIMATFTEDDILNGKPAKIELVSKSEA